MAVALEIRICDLLPEFFTNTLILLCPLQTARAVTAGTLQSLPNRLNHFFIFIQSDSHLCISSAIMCSF